MSDKAQKILLSAMLLGSLVACSPKEDNNSQDEGQPTTEVPAQDPVVQNDPYGNIALFEATRSKIKFSLAFVENFYDHTYHCGRLAKGYGMTVIYDEHGKARDVRPGETCTMASANIDMDRYLTFSTLKSIREDVKVSLDENTLLTACVIQYCIGPSKFRNSSFLKALNNGAKGKDLVKWLTLYRKDPGVLKRCYFFAAIVCGEMEFSDLLDVRANGCYDLALSDILCCKTSKRTDNVNNIKKDADNCGIWNFDNLSQNLEIASGPRPRYETKDVKDIVLDDVWNDVSNGRARVIDTIMAQDTITFADAQQMYTCGQLNDSSYVAYQNGDSDAALDQATSKRHDNLLLIGGLAVLGVLGLGARTRMENDGR